MVLNLVDQRGITVSAKSFAPVRPLFACILAILCAFGNLKAVASMQEQGPALRVEGIVLDRSGAPVADAQVSLSVGSTAAVARATTAIDGRFAFEKVRASSGIRRQQRPLQRLLGRPPLLLVIEEEERPVLQDRTALRKALLVVPELILFRGCRPRPGQGTPAEDDLSSNPLCVWK